MPTGESISFVHTDYGILRTTTLLPRVGQTRESNYQGYLRSAYMDIRFQEISSGQFIHPPKWIIGSSSALQDAVSYEQENDERVRRMMEGLSIQSPQNVLVPLSHKAQGDDSDIRTPCKVTCLDTDDENWLALQHVLQNSRTTNEDRAEVMNLLDKMYQSGTIELSDPDGLFKFDRFKLKTIRRYRKHSKEQIEERKEQKKEKYTPVEEDYRFDAYQSSHELRLPHIKDKVAIESNECELMCALDKFEYKDTRNPKSVMWFGYRCKKE